MYINFNRTSIFVVILDGFTGILAGFAIFSVLGNKIGIGSYFYYW